MLIVISRALSFLVLSVCLCLTILKFTCCASMAIAKPGCNTTCGNLTVPYPFGIGLDEECALDKFYIINCNYSYNPPKAFIRKGNLEVMNISLISGQLRIINSVATTHYENEVELGSDSVEWISMDLKSYPIVFSDTANKLTVVGCDDYAFIVGLYGEKFRTGCIAGCSNPSDVIEESCSGIGCCQISIPKGLKSFNVSLKSLFNHAAVSNFNPYGYAFLAEQDKFRFDVNDLNNPNFRNRTMQNVPVVIDWYVGMGQNCVEAQEGISSYACQNNTKCTDFEDDATSRGYRCSCLPGYEGNPYLSPGCTDIDECEDSKLNTCSHICTNSPGGYICSCPKEYYGDGQKSGTSCVKNPSYLATKLSLGISVGLLLLLIITWIWFATIRRNKQTKMKEKFFEHNGGFLLKQRLIQNEGSRDPFTIFTEDELKAATNNFNEDRLLGKGGYGTVYKGIFKDGREVAIKKSKVVDKTQVDQFINEVAILTQINHRNVVKLLGCCLETEVPLLVYEVISNGTLFEHIQKYKGITSWLTWANCIRVATETANAVMYLHSAASIPIIHRDIKSTNILLTESYTAKVSDFGASRLVPIDQIQVTTLVQGTLGYLDPEYFHTSQLTKKSDVYSFGVVLAELLTREKHLCPERKIEERNLATYFLKAFKEDRLMEILDPQIVREASEDQLVKMAKLVKECLNLRGEDRPTMKEVVIELEGFKKPNTHSWFNQNNQEAINFIGEQDLYNVPSSTTMEYSGNYSMEISLITDINHPR